MPILRSGHDRYLLRPGTNTLGGRGADAVPVATLAWQPAIATITVPEYGPVLIQRITAAVVVRLDDVPLGVAPAELRHGAHIDIGPNRLVYELGETTHETPIPSGPVTERREVSSGSGFPAARPPAAVTRGARLLNLKTDESFLLPARKVVIGRDLECDLVIDDMGVSRRHASISPVPGGYLLTDESSNGTLVNGARVIGTHILDHGDVLRLHDAELRFEIEGAEGEAAPLGASASRAPTTVLDMSRLRTELPGTQKRAAGIHAPTATLEIIRGPFAGASFHIDRPVVSIGRGEQSDVRIRDESVSTAHATLLRKGETWYVVDLRSVNGTFVDGYSVAGERELHTGATLRIGGVEMLFRSFLGGVEEPSHRKKGRGLVGWLWKLLGIPPKTTE